MTAPVFVDSNVFVYRFDTTDMAKQRLATAWLDHLWANRLGRISTQVQHELYATLTRKLSMSRADARRIVTALQAWEPVAIGFEVVERAWSLEDRHSLSWWDALIVAAANAAGAAILLTEDLGQGEVYGSVHVVNPFRQSPPEEVVQERSPAP